MVSPGLLVDGEDLVWLEVWLFSAVNDPLREPAAVLGLAWGQTIPASKLAAQK